MKKETIAEKMARKAFLSENFQQQWAVHMGAFGPILEPAFADDYASRVHLMAALNHLSRRDVKNGLKKLEQLRDKCVTNADKAAWLFFMGLGFEFAGAREQMLSCYRSAGDFGHRFYMPYLKLAKFFQQGCLYDRAEENYRLTIGCFDGTGLSEADRRILGSAYTGLATVLTMMHRYEEANGALESSRQLWPVAPGRAAAEAVLYALGGEWEKAEESLSVLRSHAPEACESVTDMVKRIREGKEPMFCTMDVEEEKNDAFWQWFLENREELEDRLSQEEYPDDLAETLNALFPFMQQELDPEFCREEDGKIRMLLPDYYAAALTHGYETLLAQMPEELADGWIFEIVRTTV